ncbi:uncharacterized protein CDV56_105461 [Aspergillus thermomutatus]|uniref:Uncharacterized protein n=1 Tax=Aspergillus thermomutatus TaxID=41047 RepID=A0A397GU33_ASPTH|nr:uncharacterized protein CDV56_105461 [Aspergillus thermomutatus]RHZ51560.1 hypothetical protein CDV56_105461 [Aspergillus thermomutatus]
MLTRRLLRREITYESTRATTRVATATCKKRLHSNRGDDDHQDPEASFPDAKRQRRKKKPKFTTKSLPRPVGDSYAVSYGCSRDFHEVRGRAILTVASNGLKPAYYFTFVPDACPMLIHPPSADTSGKQRPYSSDENALLCIIPPSPLLNQITPQGHHWKRTKMPMRGTNVESAGAKASLAESGRQAYPVYYLLSAALDLDNGLGTPCTGAGATGRRSVGLFRAFELLSCYMRRNAPSAPSPLTPQPRQSWNVYSFNTWSFEAALPRCRSDLKRTAGITPPTVEKEGGGLRSSLRSTRPLNNTNNPRVISRKGMPWLPEEEDLWTTVVRRLLEDADVRVDVRDHEGIDALKAAENRHHHDVVGLLQAFREGHHRVDGIFAKPDLPRP